MDVDEDEDATQRPKKVQDFGIEVDFESLDDDTRDSGSVEQFDKGILRLNADIERMAPNLKATERSVSLAFLPVQYSDDRVSGLTMSKQN